MLVDEHTKDYRREVCGGCPKRRGDFKLLGFTIFKRIAQCRVCKCAVSLKTMWKDSKCPKDKW